MLFQPVMKCGIDRPVLQQPRPVAVPGFPVGSGRGVLGHGVEVDDENPLVVPEQVGGLEVAVADPEPVQRLEQRRDGGRFGGGGRLIRVEVFEQVLARAEGGDQEGASAQGAVTLFEQGKRGGRRDAVERQPMPGQPGVPGPARAPEAGDGVPEIFQIVAFEDDGVAAGLGQGDGAGASVFQEFAVGDGLIGGVENGV